VTDFAAHQIVIAREHLDIDPVPPQGLDRRRRGLFRRIEEGDVAAKDEI
jgi:hypothetical protein